MSNPNIKSTASNLQLFYDKEVAISVERLIESVVVEVTAHRSALQPEQIMESNDEVLNINSLPVEMVINIFSHLSHNELGRIARVCKRFNMLTRSPSLWKEVNVVLHKNHGSHNSVTQCFVKTLPSCVTGLTIYFWDIDAGTEHLNFEEFSARLQERCPHLKKLFLLDAKLSDSLPLIINLCTQFLQDLKILIIYSSIFPDCPAREMFSDTSKIEVLCVFWSVLGRLNKPPFSRMPHLKKLCLYRTDVYSWFKGDTSFLNQLQVLDLGGTYLSSKMFPAIQNHGFNLKELYLCETSLSDEDLKFNNSVFPQLQTICLRRCGRVTCKGVVFLIQSCQSLQSAYVNQDVAAMCAIHPFIISNKCKLGIVKDIDICSDHKDPWKMTNPIWGRD